MHTEVHKKFPNSKHLVSLYFNLFPLSQFTYDFLNYQVLSGFFFLRFLSPAVVSPYAYGIIDGIRHFFRIFLNLIYFIM